MQQIKWSGRDLTWEDIVACHAGPVDIRLAPSVEASIRHARAFVEARLLDQEPHYGINTGVGMLARTRISPDDLGKLQLNIIRSHAAGVGEPLSAPVVRLMLMYRAFVLSMGHSGVRLDVVEALLALLKHDALPIVPSKGSVGASGDLAPLSHLALCLVGEGEMLYRNTRQPSREVLKEIGLTPLTLQAKEGLSLVNGTQAICAVLTDALIAAERMQACADAAAALTIEGMFGSVKPFSESVASLRRHSGHHVVSKRIRSLLSHSQIVASHAGCHRVQDPYSLRCVPQVHGMALDVIEHVKKTLLNEIHSCTDNPLLFPDEGTIISGGNFHGVAVAHAADWLAMALTDLGCMVERRIEQLTNPKAGELSVRFLTPNPGLHSGMMMAHVTASALASENKTLAHPASIDSIPTSAGQEDHVSMGMWAARKARMVADNVAAIIAIELVSAAQAIDLHPEPLEAGEGTKRVYEVIRGKVPFMTEDRILATDIEAVCHLLPTIAQVAVL